MFRLGKHKEQRRFLGKPGDGGITDMSDPKQSQTDFSREEDICWEGIEAIFRAAYIRTKCTHPEKLDILLRERPGICKIRRSAGLLNYPMVPSTGLFVFFSEDFIPGETLSPLCLLQTHRQREGRREEYYLSLHYTATAQMTSAAAVFSVRKWRDNKQYCLAGDQSWEPASPITDPVDPKAPDYIWEEMCRGTGSKNLISALRNSGGPRLTGEILIQALEKYAEPVEFLNRAGGCGRFVFLDDLNTSAAASMKADERGDHIPAIVPAQMGWAGTTYLYESPGRYCIALFAEITSDNWEITDFFCKTGQMITLPEIEGLLRDYKKETLYIRFGEHDLFAPEYPIAHNIHRALDDIHGFCESSDPDVRKAANSFAGLLRMIPEDWTQERLEAGAFWLY